MFAGVYLGRVVSRLCNNTGAVQQFLQALHSAMTQSHPVTQLYDTVTRVVSAQCHDTVTASDAKKNFFLVPFFFFLLFSDFLILECLEWIELGMKRCIGELE